MNVLQSLFQSTVEQQPPPLHAGEAFHTWTYWVELSEARGILLVLANHTADNDLKELIEHFIADVLDPQRRTCEQFMKKEGITLGEVTPDVPKADEREIPPGAKMIDSQIAQMIVVKVVGLAEYAHRALSTSLRDDVGAMFWNFYQQVVAQGYTLKPLMRKRGWLRLPPSFQASVSGHQGSH